MPTPLWSAGILPAFVQAGETPALPDLRAVFGPFSHPARTVRAALPTFPVVVARHFDDPRGIRQAPSRSSEKARERASRRGVGPRIPGMNTGPNAACGGKRPSTGVVPQPFARDLRSVGTLGVFDGRDVAASSLDSNHALRRASGLAPQLVVDPQSFARRCRPGKTNERPPWRISRPYGTEGRISRPCDPRSELLGYGRMPLRAGQGMDHHRLGSSLPLARRQGVGSFFPFSLSAEASSWLAGEPLPPTGKKISDPFVCLPACERLRKTQKMPCLLTACRGTIPKLGEEKTTAGAAPDLPILVPAENRVLRRLIKETRGEIEPPVSYSDGGANPCS